MATLSWVRGQFGLGSLSLIAEAFNGALIDEFAVVFNEDKSAKFTLVSQQTDPSLTELAAPSNPTFENVYSVT
tara:strand:- start:13 stop:231 length:219 start_codon:yes stop_codon:yes gene_type:complete